MENTNWQAYADVNPFEHGGVWVKQDTDFPEGSTYLVVSMEYDESAEVGHLHHVAIDTTDEWLDRKAVESYMDLKEGYSELDYAYGCYHYHGPTQFASEPLYINDEEEMVTHLTKYGITL